MRGVLGVLVAGLSALGLCAHAAEALDGLFAPTEAAAVVGNGALTATVDGSGRIVNCRWPSPGYHNHVVDGSDPRHGVKWGLRLEDRTLWLTDSAWRFTQRWIETGVPVLRSEGLHDSGLAATQFLLAHPERNLLAARIELSGTGPVTQLIWHASLAPCTRHVPELPIADGAWQGLNDFAAFVLEPGPIIVHFRPDKPQSRHWREAAHLIERGAAADEWAAFRNGVWIAYGADNPAAGFDCGERDGDASAFARAETGRLGNIRGAVGRCDSALALDPAGAPRPAAVVFVAFGESLREALDTLAFARERGWDGLVEETRAHWTGVMETVSASAVEPLQALLALADRDSGAVARAPVAQPPLALDFPDAGAVAVAAFDRLGLHERAAQRIRFQLDAVRTREARGKPVGSVPAACYTDGVEAVPHLVLDLNGPAWALWACRRHAAALAPEQRGQFLDASWEKIDLMGRFLAGWADTRTGAPLHSFEPQRLRDAQTNETLLTVYMGLGSAVAMADALGRPRPEWTQRRDELDGLIRGWRSGEQRPWPDAPPLAFWTEEAASADTIGWDALIAREIERLLAAPDATPSRLLAPAALVSRERLARLGGGFADRLRAALGDVVAPDSGTPSAPSTPDALDAALRVLAAANLAVSGD